MKTTGTRKTAYFWGAATLSGFGSPAEERGQTLWVSHHTDSTTRIGWLSDLQTF